MTQLVKSFGEMKNKLESEPSLARPDVFASLQHKLESQSDTRNWTLDIPAIDIDLKKTGVAKQRKLFEENGAKLRIYGHIEAKDGKIKTQKIHVCLIYGAHKEKRCHNNQNKKISCCDTNGDRIMPRIARKFHFDIEETETEGKKTTESHLQYGGLYSEDEDTHYCLDYDIELPRIPQPPLSLMSIFHLFMNEFEVCEDFYTDSHWKSYVKESEDLFMKGFFSIVGRDMDRHKTLYDASRTPSPT